MCLFLYRGELTKGLILHLGCSWAKQCHQVHRSPWQKKALVNDPVDTMPHGDGFAMARAMGVSSEED